MQKKNKSVKVDGISVDEFMGAKFTENQRCIVTSIYDSKKKARIRINSVLTGGRSKASKVFHQFDCIYH